jgi:hypothetical protein
MLQIVVSLMIIVDDTSLGQGYDTFIEQAASLKIVTYNCHDVVIVQATSLWYNLDPKL